MIECPTKGAAHQALPFSATTEAVFNVGAGPGVLGQGHAVPVDAHLEHGHDGGGVAAPILLGSPLCGRLT